MVPNYQKHGSAACLADFAILVFRDERAPNEVNVMPIQLPLGEQTRTKHKELCHGYGP